MFIGSCRVKCKMGIKVAYMSVEKRNLNLKISIVYLYDVYAYIYQSSHQVTLFATSFQIKKCSLYTYKSIKNHPK